MGDTNTASGESPIDVRYIGTKQTLERLQEVAQSGPGKFQITHESSPPDPLAGEPDTDCLVLTDDVQIDVSVLRSIQTPVILYTRADPMELDDPILSAVESVVTYDKAERLFQSIRRLSAPPSNQQNDSLSQTVVDTHHGRYRLFEELIERAQDGLFVLDAGGYVVFLNQSFADLLGYEKEEVLDIHVSEVFPPGEFETVQEHVMDHLEAGNEQAMVEAVLEHKDGSHLDIVVNLTVREKQDQTYGGILGVARDVTAQRKRIDELERNETLMQAIGDPVCTLDRNGYFQYVNDAFQTVTGYETEIATEASIDLLFDGEDASTLQNGIENAQAADESVTTVEVTAQTKDGEMTPLECRLTTLPTSEDHVVAVFYDITQHKERENRLSKFASVVSHDLRNPMDVALGRAEMLPEIADVDETTERHLHDIYASLKRMERLIQDVLTLTRQREECLNLSVVPLDEAVSEAWANVATENATLAVETDCTIKAHESRLSRLFENLFRNAIQHGGEDVTVTVETTKQDGEITLCIADDGPGITDEDKTQIFEDGFTTTKEGTGLGLAIVKEIMRAHDWEMTVTDSDDGGAEFKITGVRAVKTD